MNESCSERSSDRAEATVILRKAIHDFIEANVDPEKICLTTGDLALVLCRMAIEVAQMKPEDLP